LSNTVNQKVVEDGGRHRPRSPGVATRAYLAGYSCPAPNFPHFPRITFHFPTWSILPLATTSSPYPVITSSIAHIPHPRHIQAVSASLKYSLIRTVVGQFRPLDVLCRHHSTRRAFDYFPERHPSQRPELQPILIIRTQRVSTMPISFASQPSRLKRPRSNSQSTSPSSSSPKRAASETEDPTELKTGFLGHNIDMTNSTTLPGSPLRDVEGENGGELVQRTDDVHLNEVENQGNEKYKQLYNDFLGKYLYKNG
jgi:hypothetical protein